MLQYRCYFRRKGQISVFENHAHSEDSSGDITELKRLFKLESCKESAILMDFVIFPKSFFQEIIGHS